MKEERKEEYGQTWEGNVKEKENNEKINKKEIRNRRRK